MQIEHTSKLLDKYETILSKSENVTRLILDERWQGAEAVRPLNSWSTPMCIEHAFT